MAASDKYEGNITGVNRDDVSIAAVSGSGGGHSHYRIKLNNLPLSIRQHSDGIVGRRVKFNAEGFTAKDVELAD